jgi:hypothetical protein
VLGLVATAVGTAGCVGGDSGGEGDDGDGNDAETTTETTAETPTETTDAGLNLREANVVDVVVESTADGYRFDVTLHHDDDGEEGYANWWQVESIEGDRLGRRDLAHAHGTRPFTRSATVSVPEETDCVVVRGHDQTHGYGGQATLVNVETGAMTAVMQGTERQPVTERGCP